MTIVTVLQLQVVQFDNLITIYEGFTVVSRMVTFPDGIFSRKDFPGKSFPGWSFSRIGRFPERRFPGGHFPG